MEIHYFMEITMSFPFHNKSVSFPTLISKPAIWNLNKTPMKLIQLETLLDMFLMMYGRDTIDANKNSIIYQD